MSHYTFDKLVGGLVDLELYAGHRAVRPVLAKVIAHANALRFRLDHQHLGTLRNTRGGSISAAVCVVFPGLPDWDA